MGRPAGDRSLPARRGGAGLPGRAAPRRPPVPAFRERAAPRPVRPQSAGRRGRPVAGAARFDPRRARLGVRRLALHLGAARGAESCVRRGGRLARSGARAHSGATHGAARFARPAPGAGSTRPAARWPFPRRAGRARAGRPAGGDRARRAAAPTAPALRSTSARPASGRAAGLHVTAPRSTPRASELFGVNFQNPVLLASGTAGFGREVRDVIDLDALGGIVTKAVTPEPRRGHAAPRGARFPGGMLNAVGLANPGLAAVRDHELPWLAAHLQRARVIVNVAGATVADYAQVIARLTDLPVITAFEINASCPNTAAGGLEFGATPEGLRELVRRCRAVATRPIAVKLSPVLPDIAGMACVAEQAGADAITLVNTIPGTLDGRLGNGAGGVSGPAL